jgi:hypothetical protein
MTGRTIFDFHFWLVAVTAHIASGCNSSVALVGGREFIIWCLTSQPNLSATTKQPVNTRRLLPALWSHGSVHLIITRNLAKSAVETYEKCQWCSPPILSLYCTATQAKTQLKMRHTRRRLQTALGDSEKLLRTHWINTNPWNQPGKLCISFHLAPYH